MTIARVHLGGPVWSCSAWLGSLFPPSARAPTFLGHYAAVFNAVEGNSTFYAVPPAETFARWRESTPAGFRFCLKVPRAVTHDAGLLGAAAAMREFLDASAALGDRLGPTMIQLPPTFGPPQVARLRDFLRDLPPERRWSVEPRHPAWFGEQKTARDFEELLAARGVDRVAFDTTLLHDAPATDAAIAEAQRRKPRNPRVMTRTGDAPVVRIVVVRDAPTLEDELAAWAECVAGWIDRGAEPHVFFHTPDDVEVPSVCARFHAMLAARTDVGVLPEWPGRIGRQISLFDRDLR